MRFVASLAATTAVWQRHDSTAAATVVDRIGPREPLDYSAEAPAMHDVLVSHGGSTLVSGISISFINMNVGTNDNVELIKSRQVVNVNYLKTAAKIIINIELELLNWIN